MRNLKKYIIKFGMILLIAIPIVTFATTITPRTIVNPSNGSSLSSSVMRSELQILENEISNYINSLATSSVSCTGNATCGAGSYVVGNPLIINATGGSSGNSFVWPFTVSPGGVSTSTTVGFLNGLFSTASSTFVGNTLFTAPITVTSVSTSTIANDNTVLWVPSNFVTAGCAGDVSKTDFGACVNALYALPQAQNSGNYAVQIMVPDIKVTSAQWITPISFNHNGEIASFDCVRGATLIYGGTATSTLFNMSNPTGHLVSDDYGCSYQGNSSLIAQGNSNSKTTVGIGFGGSNGAVNVNFHDNSVNGFGQDIHISNNAYMISLTHNAISGGNGGMLGDLLYNDHSNNSGEALSLIDNTFTDPANNLIGNDIYFANGGLASAFISGKSLDDAQIYIGSSNGTVVIQNFHIENSACQTGAYNAYTPIQGVSSDQYTQLDISNLEIANDCAGAQSFNTIIQHGGQLFLSGVHIDNYAGGTVSTLVNHSLDNGLESEQVCKVVAANGALTNIIGGSGPQAYSLAAGDTCISDTSNSYAYSSYIDGGNLVHFRNGNQDVATVDDNGNWVLGVGSGSKVVVKNAMTIATSTNGFNVALDVNGAMAIEGGNGLQLWAPVGNTNHSTIAYNSATGKVDTTWPFDFDNGGISVGASYAATTPPSGGIISSGSMGIGTSSPYTSFGVAGTIVSNNILATSTTASSTFSAQVQMPFLTTTVPHILFGDGTNNSDWGFSFAAGRGMEGYTHNGNPAGNDSYVFNAGANKSIDFYVNGTNNSFVSGTDAITINGAGTTNIGFVGLGTSTPSAKFVSLAASTTIGTIQTAYTGVVSIIAGLENTTAKLFEVIDQWGGIYVSGDAPTLTACTGGTVGANSNQRVGSVTMGTGLTSCGVLFAHPYTTGTSIHVFLNQDSGTLISFDAQSPSVTGFTITAGTVATGDVVSYQVIAGE